MKASVSSVRSPLTLGCLAIVVLVGGFGGWSLSVKLSGAVIAPGQIEVQQKRQIVQHPDGGVVDQILVSEGQAVKPGDLLIRLDGNEIRSKLTIVENQYYELVARRSRLEAERDDAASVIYPPELLAGGAEKPDVRAMMVGQTRLFRARLESLSQQIDQLNKQKEQLYNQINGVDAQVDSLKTQVELASEELGVQQDLLNRKLTQSAKVLDLKRQVAQMYGSIGQLTSSRAQLLGKIAETDIEIIKLRVTRREDAITQLRDLSYHELDLAEQRRSLNEKIERLDIRAPVSGIVYGLTVTTPRSVIRAAEPILYLVPQDRPLVIAAQVPVIHINEVHLGQRVRLSFPSFHDRLAPDVYGFISVISADAFKDDRTQRPYYRVEISIEPGQIAEMRGGTLLPGMQVEAFIITTNRTPMAYLLKPFADYFEHAFRDG